MILQYNSFIHSNNITIHLLHVFNERPAHIEPFLLKCFKAAIPADSKIPLPLQQDIIKEMHSRNVTVSLDLHVKILCKVGKCSKNEKQQLQGHIMLPHREKKLMLQWQNINRIA